ncbi:MAG: phosphotransferase [Anaerorhabdus sp.]
MIEKILNDLIHEELILTKTNLGLTNTIYISTLHNQKVVVRVPKKELLNSIAFSNEEQALTLLRPLALDAKELFYDPSSRIRITKWIDDTCEFKDIQDKQDGVIRVARLLKTLHQANLKSGVRFDGLSLLKEYQSQILHPLYSYSEFNFILDEINHINNPVCLCHNDVVSGNILFTDKQDYLIDYEYSKDNDPLFDITSFFTENKITDPILRSHFYQEYFNHQPTSSQQHDLDCWEIFHNYLWCCWANMMYDTLHDDIYRHIAQDKYEALCASVKK